MRTIVLAQPDVVEMAVIVIRDLLDTPRIGKKPLVEAFLNFLLLHLRLRRRLHIDDAAILIFCGRHCDFCILLI